MKFKRKKPQEEKIKKEKRISKKQVAKEKKAGVIVAKIETKAASVKDLSKSKAQSPKISRFIAEQPQKTPIKLSFMQVGLHAINILSLIGLLILGIGFGRYVDQLDKLHAQKKEIAQKRNTWEKIATAHPLYRDAYVNAGILSYQLGDTLAAKEFAHKALLLDPNDSLAIGLAEVSGGQK